MRLVVALLVVVVMVAVVGCAAAREQTTATTTESTAGGEMTTEATVTPSAAAPQASDATDSDKHILDCQLDEASKDNADSTKQGQFVDEAYQEAEKRGVDPEQVLSERGYDCGWSALQQSKGKG